MNRKVFFVILAGTLLSLTLQAKHRILSPNVKSLQVVVNQDWLSMPIMTLGSSDVLQMDFDELSHDYIRFKAHLEPCNPDWTPTEGLFESDWLEGFNDWPIEEYENSLNTTVLYTHYKLQIPNEQCRLKMSGNYRLHIMDEDDEEVAVAEFRVLEPITTVGLGVSTNTDIDHQRSHQQVSMSVNCGNLRITNPNEQIQTFVLQNCREDNMKENVRPNYVTPGRLQWEHNRQLIFEAGNEYHKYETLDPSHPTMGLAGISWNEEDKLFEAFPFPCEQQRNYTYNEDADGAFLIRNSENYEIDRTCDYIRVHYVLKPLRQYENTQVIIDGQWTTEAPETYFASYDEENGVYHASVLQKQGYYNYQFLMLDPDGLTHRMPEEGSFYQTENRYQALVYFKGTGQRSWQLVGYQQITFRE